MNGVTVPYESSGRTRQKARTRAALVTAARELLREGVTPTVEEAAERAGISRTTAYRYFANQRALVIASYPELDAPSLLPEDAPDDVVARLEIVTAAFLRLTLAYEHEARAMLRLSLESPPPAREELPLRQGRAIAWFEDALAPLRERLPAAGIRRLALTIRATLGIESLVWLTDVAGLTREEAVDLMRASARTLLSAALAEVYDEPA
jgi:AcrR family transcriptional regulator